MGDVRCAAATAVGRAAAALAARASISIALAARTSITITLAAAAFAVIEPLVSVGKDGVVSEDAVKQIARAANGALATMN